MIIEDSDPYGAITGAYCGMPERKNLSKLALISFILGIASIFSGLYGGGLAIITGIGAVFDIKSRKTDVKGMVLAITGIVLGCVFFIIGLKVLFLNFK